MIEITVAGTWSVPKWYYLGSLEDFMSIVMSQGFIEVREHRHSPSVYLKADTIVMFREIP